MSMNWSMPYAAARGGSSDANSWSGSATGIWIPLSAINARCSAPLRAERCRFLFCNLPVRSTMSDSLHAETIEIAGHGDDQIEAYISTSLGGETRGGVVVIHHMPGYDR